MEDFDEDTDFEDTAVRVCANWDATDFDFDVEYYVDEAGKLFDISDAFEDSEAF